MATIIRTGGALGNHRCDARCHTADVGSDCDCICGGRYHAIGSTRAAQRRLTEDFLAGALPVKPGPDLTVRTTGGVQESLLDA